MGRRTKQKQTGLRAEPIPRQLSTTDKDEHRWDEGGEERGEGGRGVRDRQRERRIPDIEKLVHAV